METRIFSAAISGCRHWLLTRSAISPAGCGSSKGWAQVPSRMVVALMKGSPCSQGTWVSHTFHLVPSSWGLLSILPHCASQELPSLSAMVVTKSHKKASCIKLRETIELVGGVGRQDPCLLPIFPNIPRRTPSVEPNLKTTDPCDFETKEGRLGSCEHCILHCSLRCRGRCICSLWPWGLSGQSGGQTKGLAHSKNLKSQTKSPSKGAKPPLHRDDLKYSRPHSLGTVPLSCGISHLPKISGRPV